MFAVTICHDNNIQSLQICYPESKSQDTYCEN